MTGGARVQGVSATVQTTDTHNGSGNAALLRTVGYGTLSTSSVIGNTPTAHYAGELYLGTINGTTPAYGITFTSRPAKLSFWYKYSGYADTDRGVAEIKVYDTNGNLITSQDATLTNTSSYTQKELTLSYPRGAAKAANIQVNFKSTNQTPTANDKKGNELSIGAQLYIDDVELVY